MKLLIINGTEMPSPTKYDLKLADIDSPNTSRSDSGYLTRERLRADVASLEVGWDNITTTELNTIKAAIAAASFPVRFFTSSRIQSGSGVVTYKDATMYAGDRNISMISLKPGAERWSISFSLIEL